MLGNNETSLTLIKDPESQNQMKYINVMYYHIHGLVEDGELAIKWIKNSAILVDSLMKALSAEPFKKH